MSPLVRTCSWRQCHLLHHLAEKTCSQNAFGPISKHLASHVTCLAPYHSDKLPLIIKIFLNVLKPSYTKYVSCAWWPWRTFPSSLLFQSQKTSQATEYLMWAIGGWAMGVQEAQPYPPSAPREPLQPKSVWFSSTHSLVSFLIHKLPINSLNNIAMFVCVHTKLIFTASFADSCLKTTVKLSYHKVFCSVHFFFNLPCVILICSVFLIHRLESK